VSDMLASNFLNSPALLDGPTIETYLHLALESELLSGSIPMAFGTDATNVIVGVRST
jgi:hypothetical protein